MPKLTRVLLPTALLLFAVTRASLAGSATTAAPGADAAGTPIVNYDLASSYVPELYASILFTSSPTFQVPLVLSEPTNGFGHVNWMAYGFTAYSGSVGFKGSQTTGSYTLTFTDPPTYDAYPGWLLGKGLSYLITPQGLAWRSDRTSK